MIEKRANGATRKRAMAFSSFHLYLLIRALSHFVKNIIERALTRNTNSFASSRASEVEVDAKRPELRPDFHHLSLPRIGTPRCIESELFPKEITRNSLISHFILETPCVLSPRKSPDFFEIVIVTITINDEK